MRYSVLNFSTSAVDRTANWARKDVMLANAVGGEEGEEEKKSTSGGDEARGSVHRARRFDVSVDR